MNVTFHRPSANSSGSQPKASRSSIQHNHRCPAPAELPYQGELLEIRVQSMDAVLDVVTMIGRVGASIVMIHAEDCRIWIDFKANALVTRRLPSLLQSLVSVLEVSYVTRSEAKE